MSKNISQYSFAPSGDEVYDISILAGRAGPRCAVSMPTPSRRCYELYLDDDRYAVPTLHLIVTDNAASARRTAERLLDENSHHLGAELWGHGRRLARLEAGRGLPLEPKG